MKGLSIQTRVFIIALLPILIISLLLGIYIIGSRISDAEKALNLYGQTSVKHVAHSSRHAVLKNNRHVLHEITNLIIDEDDVQSITFFGPEHELLAFSGSEDVQSPEHLKKITFDPEKQTIIEGKDTITFTAPIIVNDLNLAVNSNTKHLSKKALPHKRMIGWASLTLSKTQTILAEYKIILTTLSFLSICLLISILLARQISRRLTTPLLKMRAAINKLEQGELETRLEAISPGELGELEEGINNMAVALHSARDELQKHIDLATVNLKQSLETIEMQNVDLAQAQKEALEGSRIKSEFIANMSHEVRTPMNGIVGFTNLLLETELSPLQRNYLTTIQKSTLNLLNLMNNILDFSRLDAGQLRLEYLAFDLRDTIEDALTIMSPLANAKQLEFTALIDEDIPKRIISDPSRLKQIIVNLTSNAIKFTDRGEVTVRVSLETRWEKSVKLRIAISDTGIGLPPADQSLIFRAFQQADTSIARKYGGTGLGLAICKKLIDQMGGSIGMESEEGKGSVFWFTFTAEKIAADLADSEHDIVNLSNTTIYLAETHTDTRIAIKNTLTHWEINATDFNNLDTLITQLKESTNPPSLVIAGINQQQIQDGTATAQLRSMRSHYTGPIIILTNSADQASHEYLLTTGATATLSKPVIRNNLYHTIVQLITETHPRSTIKGDDSAPQLHGKQILCVDDNIYNANLVNALLSNTHATITIAHDGLDAVRLAEKYAFDLILMDLRMPRMDGVEALKRIRNLSTQHANVPIIALSAHIAEHEYKDLTSMGFNDYLTKPVIKSTLLKTIHKWVTHPESQKTKAKKSAGPEQDVVIDWELGLKLAGNKKELADEMLTMLVKSLPEEIEKIRQLKEKNDSKELLQRLHKLHGAVCYCGVPRLKRAIHSLESALKKNKHEELPELFKQFESEMDDVISHHNETNLH